MLIECFEVMLKKSMYEYYVAGDELQGTIQLCINERQRLRIARLSLRVFGNVQTAWRNKLTETIYESRELILDEYKDLTSKLSVYCSEAMEVLSAECNVDFSIKLPLDLVSTVDKDGYGHIKYTCMAVLDVPQDGGSEIIAESDFRVMSFLNLDAPHFRRPTEAREQVNIIGFCFRRPKGWICARVVVGELGLLPGQTVPIGITIENTVSGGERSAKKHADGAHHCTLLSLCQQLEFCAQSRREPGVIGRKSLTTAVRSCGTCKAIHSKGPETKTLDFIIPEDLPPTSANENALIVCSYFFRLDMEHFDVIVPVVIGSRKTLKKHQKQRQSNCDVKMNNNNDDIDKGSSDEGAVVVEIADITESQEQLK